jgi:hypothetical protein
MEQGVQKTKMLISHIRRNDDVGKLLKISHDHLQLQAGVSWPVMSRPGHKQRQYVDPCYLTHLWQFNDANNTHLRFEHDNWIKPQRQGDTFIMEELSLLNGITKNELVQAQRCRLYLGVTTMADICTANGLSICEWALHGQECPRKSNFLFPHQLCPSKPVWNTWTRLIRLRYCTASAMRLDQPLGKWYHGQIQQSWDTIIDPTNKHIYIWHNGQVRIYE